VRKWKYIGQKMKQMNDNIFALKYLFSMSTPYIPYFRAKEGFSKVHGTFGGHLCSKLKD
jgi:hypothetical protein